MDEPTSFTPEEIEEMRKAAEQIRKQIEREKQIGTEAYKEELIADIKQFLGAPTDE